MHNTRQVRLLVALSLAIAPPAFASPCAAPDVAPTIHSELPGFEKAIATVIGRELEARVELTWRAQRHGFLRDPLLDDECTLLLAAPAGMHEPRRAWPRTLPVGKLIGFLEQSLAPGMQTIGAGFASRSR